MKRKKMLLSNEVVMYIATDFQYEFGIKISKFSESKILLFSIQLLSLALIFSILLSYLDILLVAQT
jgi:hypothetical protein